MSKLFFCSTFNQKLYDFTAKNMLQTWIDQECDGEFILGIENVQIDGDFTTSHFIHLDITNHPLYNNWISKFADYIPICYGGNKEDWSKEIAIDAKQASYCYQAARWFYKIVILKLAQELVQPEDYLVYVDCDSRFLNRIELETIQSICNDAEFIFHFGKWRAHNNKGIESGLLIFKESGYQVIDIVYDEYISGRFLEAPMWDDGYIFRWTLPKYQNIVRCKDLISDNVMTGRVADYSPFKDFIFHDKGSTSRAKIVDKI